MGMQSGRRQWWDGAGRSGPSPYSAGSLWVPIDTLVHIVLARPAANPTRKRIPVNTSCAARDMAPRTGRCPLRMLYSEGITQSRY